MKSYYLLESIGAVDDDLLQECETAKFIGRSVTFKVLLVAAIIAMLSVTAVAAQFLFADVSGGDVVPSTFSIHTLDADWDIVEDRKTTGYRLEADIEAVQDVPMKLLYPYLPTVPDDWVWSETGSAKYDGEYGMIGITWIFTQERTEYKVFYRQESAYFYNTRETPTVWDLLDVPEDVVVTGQTASIGEASVYRVTVTAAKDDINFPYYDQTLIFWSDGYSIFQLAVPACMSDAQIYEIMCSLTLQEDLEVALNNLK